MSVVDILQDYRPSQPKQVFVVRASFKEMFTKDGVEKRRKKSWFWEFFSKADAVAKAKRLSKVAYHNDPLYDVQILVSPLEFTQMEIPT